MNKLRALGMALFACLALGAFTAQGAMAEQLFHSDGEPTYLTGHQEEGTNEFLLDDGSGLSVVCGKATFTGKIPEETATEVTVHPVYSECGVNEAAAENAIVHTDGCNFILTSHLEETTENEEHATTAIECETTTEPEHIEHKIEITLPGTCTIVITAQAENELTHGVVYKNEPNDENPEYITVSATVHGIHWELTNEFICTLGGIQASTGEDATYFNQITVEGFSDEAHENHTAIWWK